MLIPGLSNKDAEYVFVGGTAATVVYLGTTQVWPTTNTGTPGVMGEQLIINATNTPAGQMYSVSIPAAATKVDVVLIGGGGGGGDGGNLGRGEGGGCGPWKTGTYTIGATGDFPTGHVLKMGAGWGGDGGLALTNTGGTQGGESWILDKTNELTGALLISVGGNPNSMPDRTGATPADIVFNGRTYKGGAGGNSTNQNGSNGQAPGGGGQGGNNEVTGNFGGKGGSGGIYLYFY